MEKPSGGPSGGPSDGPRDEPSGEPTHLVLTPVREARAADFERFLAEVVAPAIDVRRPDLSTRWQVLRAAGSVAGAVTFVFLLHGGSLMGDWDLDALLAAHYGEDGADRLAREWGDTFAELAPWADATAALGQAANQLAWTLTPLDVTGGSTPAAPPGG
jgi:hypothetical protein